MYFPIRWSLLARPEPDNTFWTASTPLVSYPTWGLVKVGDLSCGYLACHYGLPYDNIFYDSFQHLCCSLGRSWVLIIEYAVSVVVNLCVMIFITSFKTVFLYFPGKSQLDYHTSPYGGGTGLKTSGTTHG